MKREIVKGYKIIEIKNGNPFFMFCGWHGSKTITPDKWMKAENKMVADGTSKFRYLSGFHVIPHDLEQVKQYSKRFKKKKGKFVVEVFYHTYTNKPTKGSLALLADNIMIPIDSLPSAIPLEEF